MFYRLSSFFLAVVAGIILGYFVLLHPLISFSITDIQWPKFLTQDINAYLYDREALYIAIAAMIVTLLIPNIFLLAIIMSFVMRYSNLPRAVFYSSFISPLLDYYVSWMKIIQLKERLEINGVSIDIARLIRAEHLDAKAVAMFLTFTLLTIFVFFMLKLLPRKNKNGQRQIDKLHTNA